MTLIELSRRLGASLDALSRRAWEMGIAVDGPSTVLDAEMVAALEGAVLAEAPVPWATAPGESSARGSGLRAFELAARLGLETELLLRRTRELGMAGVTDHLSVLQPEDVAVVEESLRERPEIAVLVHREKGSAVARRRRLGRTAGGGPGHE